MRLVNRASITALCATLILSASGFVALAANPPKTGSVCKKVGISQTYKGKKYICIKSGRSLVWSKGLPLAKDQTSPTPSPSPSPSQVPTPSPTPSPSPSPTKDLSTFREITPRAQLSDLSTCKTTDLTNRPDVSNGFPRPSKALNGKADARILFVPISFTDFPFQEEDLNRNKSVTRDVADFYTKTSYGNVTITFEFLDKKLWVDMGRTAASYNLVENKPQQNNRQVVVDALSRVDSSINFDNYDGVVVESARFQSTGGGQGFPGEVFQTRNGSAKGVSLEFGTAVASFQTLAHELGHSLFGLEDLYVFLNSNRPTVPDPSPAGNWDMMSSSAREYFGWSKLLNGWLKDSQIRCLTDQKKSFHYLESLDITSEHEKIILINLTSGVTLAAEVRKSFQGVGVPGLLVYKIDSRIAHGDGPITARKQLLSSGSSAFIDGWTIQAIDSDERGVLVEVSRI